MLLSYVHDFLRAMESDDSITDTETALRHLRLLGLSDFGAVLWSIPLAGYPRVSALLPKMASLEVQRTWTGASGDVLLGQSLSFIRSMSCTYSRLTVSPLSGKRILDFGCGYGRLTRLCYFYSDDIWAVDPWEDALALCREAGLQRNLFKSEELPLMLPVPEDFDVIFAYSVLTHTSERASKALLCAMRRHLRLGGLACITIRPIEFWKNRESLSQGQGTQPSRVDMERQHAQLGFAFTPHKRSPVDGEITFGDTSMTTDWLKINAPDWRLVGFDHLPEDILQRIVFLQRA